MNLIEIADAELAKAIEVANSADKIYQSVLDHHHATRWDRKRNPQIEAAFAEKVRADAAMHEAFEKTRVIRRACELA